jgi:hypothetical protein
MRRWRLVPRVPGRLQEHQDTNAAAPFRNPMAIKAVVDNDFANRTLFGEAARHAGLGRAGLRGADGLAGVAAGPRRSAVWDSRTPSLWASTKTAERVATGSRLAKGNNSGVFLSIGQ